MGSTNVKLPVTFTKWIKTHLALWRVLVNVTLENIPEMTLKCTLVCVCLCVFMWERENNNIHGTCITASYWQPQTGPCRGRLSSTSTRIKWCAAAAASDLQHPLKEFRVESRSGALCDPGKLAVHAFRYLDIPRSWFYESNSCISLHLEKR